MKSWQAVLISAALLTAGYMVSAHARNTTGGSWHMVASGSGMIAWLYNDQDGGTVYWCDGTLKCKKGTIETTP